MLQGRDVHAGAAPVMEIGIDRVVRNIGTGHFERSLSALMAVQWLVTAGGPMWLPEAT